MRHRERPVWLAALGDVTDPATFSGTPYHCLEAGRAAGVFAGGLPLSAAGPAWRLRRGAWNLAAFLAGGGCGGFQYSDAFLDRLWRRADLGGGDCVRLLNFFQLFPERSPHPPDVRRWFYIDQTLQQLFASYTLAQPVPAVRQADAIRRESAQYLAAEGVVCQSAWAAASVLGDYGVPRERVHVVLPGANFPAAALARWEATAPVRPPRRREGDPLRLVFVGKDWRRKGLDRLLRAVRIARGQGASIRLLVIGVERAALPARLARTASVRWLGVVDKTADPDRFIELLAGADVGCLLSRAEAGGISLREFVRLGLPTIAPDVGGAPEYVVPAATTLIPPDAPDAAIAGRLVELAFDHDYLERQRQAARAGRHTAGWNRSVARLGNVLDAAG